jgi:drug/metabolite transporter (DMT)-like permease
MLAFMTGLMVAAYTTYDAFGIRVAADPLTFIAWFFVIDGISFPVLMGWWVWRGNVTLPPLGPLALRGLAGGLMGPFSFGSIMLATRLDKVGEAAVLRETSVIFAAAIGWIFLRESIGTRRLALMVLIALGAVMVEAGG